MVRISISVKNETYYQLRYYGGGSRPSEAHGGGRGGFWQGWRGTGAVIDDISYH